MLYTRGSAKLVGPQIGLWSIRRILSIPNDQMFVVDPGWKFEDQYVITSLHGTGRWWSRGIEQGAHDQFTGTRWCWCCLFWPEVMTAPKRIGSAFVSILLPESWLRKGVLVMLSNSSLIKKGILDRRIELVGWAVKSEPLLLSREISLFLPLSCGVLFCNFMAAASN